jgi:hypothetical protein
MNIKNLNKYSICRGLIPLVVYFRVVKDDAIELQCNEFEKRKASLEFSAGLFDSNQPGVLDFNISLTNAVHSVNAAMKINGVEIQRYSLSNQAPHSTHEVFPQSLLKQHGSTMEFEIIDTPMSETSVLKISDIVLWLQSLEKK